MEEKKKRNPLSKYVYTILVLVTIGLLVYFDIRRDAFWQTHLNVQPDLVLSEFHELQVQYFTTIGVMIGLFLVWAIIARLTRR